MVALVLRLWYNIRRAAKQQGCFAGPPCGGQCCICSTPRMLHHSQTGLAGCRRRAAGKPTGLQLWYNNLTG